MMAAFRLFDAGALLAPSAASGSGTPVAGVPDAAGARPTGVHAALDQPGHAVWTRSRHEPLVRSQLAAKGIEVFLPTYAQVSRWSDRRKKIEWPLFPGYCFARFDKDALSRVLRSEGVVAVLSNAGKPVPVPAYEIEALQRMVASGIDFDPCAQLLPGARVRVTTGPLEGVVGRLVRRGADRILVLAVELLNSGARVQVSSWDVQPV
jgi:transcription antitermination factor NusG